MDARTRCKWLAATAVLTLVPLVAAGSVTAAKSKLVVLLWNAEAGEAQRVQQIWSGFAAQNPDVELDLVIPSGNYWEKMKTMVAAGEQLDVVMVYPFAAGDWLASNTFLDLTPYVKRDGLDLGALFPQPIVDAFTANGALWGMPTDAGAIVTFYNKDLFAAAGLQEPFDLDAQHNWTWTSFLDDARKLTVDNNGDGKTDQYGVDDYVDLSRYINWVWANGGQLFDKQIFPTKTTFAEPKSVEALQFFIDLQLKEHVVGSGGFPKGTAAMQINQGPWYVQSIRGMSGGGNNIGTAQLPGNVTQTTSLWPNGVEVMRTSQNPDLAWKFVKYITTDPEPTTAFMRATGRTPVLKSLFRDPSLAEAPPAHREVLLQAFDIGRIAPVSPAINDIRGTIAPKYLNQAVSGKIPVKEAALSIDQEATALLIKDNALMAGDTAGTN